MGGGITAGPHNRYRGQMDTEEFRFEGSLVVFTGLKRLCRKGYSRICPERESHSKRCLGYAESSVQPTGTHAPRRLGITAPSIVYRF